jgi:hypothetical protein
MFLSSDKTGPGRQIPVMWTMRLASAVLTSLTRSWSRPSRSRSGATAPLYRWGKDLAQQSASVRPRPAASRADPLLSLPRRCLLGATILYLGHGVDRKTSTLRGGAGWRLSRGPPSLKRGAPAGFAPCRSFAGSYLTGVADGRVKLARSVRFGRGLARSYRSRHGATIAADSSRLARLR